MCEANVYLLKDGQEELIMEEVDIIRPEEGKYYLRSVMGEQKMIDGQIKSISLVNHKIIMEEAE